MTLYALAELLHKMVWELEPMGMAEYMGWIEYIESRAPEGEPGKQNLLDMDQEDMIAEMTGG